MSDLILRPTDSSKMHRAPTEVRAGEYWRWAGPEEDCPKAELRPMALPPEQPLTLLVREIRIHDGDLHSIYLAAHPSWYSSELKILADDFFRVWVLEDQTVAEARREREIAALMGKINDTTALIARGPEAEEQKLLADGIAEAEKQKAYEAWRRVEVNKIASRYGYGQEAARVAEIEALPKEIPAEPVNQANLPAALLPSGDVLAVQKQIERQVLLMKAQQVWISERTSEMQAGFSVVNAYQMEKVTAVTSGISTHISKAENLLKNVHTMKLFLGEGADLTRLNRGQGAASDAPLHLMQRMLFLDEEIYISQKFYEGFTGDDLQDLPGILGANPQILERMLPHPRCVAIARMRRGARPFEFDYSGDVSEMLAQAFEKERQAHIDSRIIILIRDGENVSMVRADEDTSRATRLFPSKAEIDGIYRHRNGEITPQDIEYSDARNAHDDRALHYKRFLLILWGLHEREGAFGDFLPKGENWLKESVASAAFRFVHDEENVLHSGMVRVSDWFVGINANLRAGSRVLIDTRKAFTADSAPTAWRNHHASTPERLRRPTDPYMVATVKRRGRELIVDMPTYKDSWRAKNDKPVMTPLIVTDETGNQVDGIFCLDAARPATVMSYINSRIERETYLNWLSLFDRALPLLKARDEEIALPLSQIDEKDELARAALAHVLHNRRARSAPGVKEGLVAAKISVLWKEALATSKEDLVLIGDLSGRAWRVELWPEQNSVRVAALKLVEVLSGEERRIPAATLEQEFHILRGRRELLALIKEARDWCQAGFTDPDNLDMVLALENSEGLSRLDNPRRWSAEEAEELVLDTANADDIDGMVALPYMDHVLAVCTVPEFKTGTGYWISRNKSMTRSITLRENLFAALIADGHGEIVKAGLRHLLKPAGVEGMFSRLSEQPGARLILSEVGIAKLFERNGEITYRVPSREPAGLKTTEEGIEKIFFAAFYSRISEEQRAHVKASAVIFAGGREDEVLALVPRI